LWGKKQSLAELTVIITTFFHHKLMNHPKQIDNRNYRSLIIAGIGTIGKSLITLGSDQFLFFEHIFAIDKNDISLIPLQNSDIILQSGDISDSQFLNTLMSSAPGPSLFVNLCSGTNNVKIRNNVALYDAAYLDSCASTTLNPDECRFSRLMPYTYSNIDTNYPHWLCWGINPGLVEIVARRILSRLAEKSRSYDVTVYEFDRLKNKEDSAKIAVGWCPEALVEEVVLSPAMEVINGIPRENTAPGARDCMVNWGSQTIPAKIVGHEDIWNLIEVPAVKNGRFYYSLSPAVMDILNMDDAKKARSKLYIPGVNDTITGLEQVAVQVNEKDMPEPKTLVWTEDHHTTWNKFGVNAVQYQTAKSLLLAIMLLQCTDYGLMPLSFNASNLPISSHEWPIFDHFMQELDINWHDGAHLNLHVKGN
jgi:hypothetical protein